MNILSSKYVFKKSIKKPQKIMMKEIGLLIFLVSILLSACTPIDDDNIDNTSTIARELNPAKTFYTNNGGTFKFRMYHWAPTEGDTINNNYHKAEVYKIIDDKGNFSIFAKGSVPAINLTGYSAILNCKGDYNSTENKNNVLIQQTSANDDFEIDTDYTRLISYNSTSGAHGSYGFAGTRIYVHSPSFFSGAISASSNQGYMFTINHANFMLSMGYNTDGGLPTLYRYNPANYTWISDAVPGLEVVPGSGIDIPLTNDASKAGNSDQVFWAWLSYTTNLSNGKINIITYNGSTFSSVTSLSGIGSIGTGWASLNTVTLCKNPDNLNNPYMVVRRYNSDIIDIYKFTGSAIESVKSGVTLSTSIPLYPGNSFRTYKDIAFSGSNIYIITGLDKNLYKLSGSTFEIVKPGLTEADDRISALESTPNGILISIVKTIPSKPLNKIVSDIVFISN